MTQTQTAIYSRTHSVVDWRYRVTGDPAGDLKVAGTHVGMPFNADAYGVVAQRLRRRGHRE